MIFQIGGSATSTSDCGTRNVILSTDAALPVTVGKEGGGNAERSNNVYHIESSCIRTVSMV